MAETRDDILHGRTKPEKDPEFPDAPEGWIRAFAEDQAKQEGLELEADHWQAIRAIQEYFAKNEVPRVRELHDAARQVVNDLGLAAKEETGWSLVAELGWLMVATREELGGLGMGLAGACTLHGELGRGVSTVPYLSAMLAIDAIGHGELRDRAAWLERLMAGEAYVAVPLADSDGPIELTKDDAIRLSGTLTALPSADRASHALVSAPDCMALVALEQAGGGREEAGHTQMQGFEVERIGETAYKRGG